MTFSVVARNNSYLAAAVASYSLAVGNAVPAVAPGIGAVLSQAWTNQALRHYALEGLRAGFTGDEVMNLLRSEDQEWEKRQVAILPARGTGAVHTGTECSRWAGAVAGTDFVVAANLVTGEAVVEAMAAPLQDAANLCTADFVDAVLASLRAGEEAGGDLRGRQSASLMLASIDGVDLRPPTLALDLRVDDSPSPLQELARLVGLWKETKPQAASPRPEQPSPPRTDSPTSAVRSIRTS